jgi:diaminopimelate decarboxylase
MRTDQTPTLGGVDARILAQTYGTPLLVLDTDALDAALRRFAELGERFGIDVAYAGKALLFVALIERLKATALKLDVCSLGELATAERARFPADRIVMHGCGKTDEELAAAAAGRVSRLVIDHDDELSRLATIADPAQPVNVLIRINSGIEAHTHAYVRTGGEGSKFGYALADAGGAIERVIAEPSLRLVGIHSHIGSNIFDPQPFEANLATTFDIYARAAKRSEHVRELVAGGGFGVEARPGGERIDLLEIAEALSLRLDDESERAGVTRPRLGLEPGRAIVAEAGTTLYRIVTVKRHGKRRFAIVDGGLADNPRPALYGAYHHPIPLGRTFASECEETTLCGRSCENDELVVAPLPTDLRSGDLLALSCTGAYTYSMAGNYNRFPKPAVIFAGDGAHRLVVRRETLDDILRNDVGGA